MNYGKGTEVWYVWKEWAKFDDEPEPRLVTPWSDPYKHEFPADLLFDSPEKAEEWRLENSLDEDTAHWVLCMEILVPMTAVTAA